MFTLNRNTIFTIENTSVPVRNAISLLERDRDRVFAETKKPGGSVVLVQKSMARSIPETEESEQQRKRERYLEEERYKISVSADKIVIYAQGSLGFIYGLLHLSEQYMGIRPFWFFMDQNVEQKKKVMVPEGVICSKDAAILFRSWKFSDAALMTKWSYHEDGVAGWNMVMEALLRCGGNSVISELQNITDAIQNPAEQFGICTIPLKEAPENAVFTYNLQDTNHVTMFPYSVEKVANELQSALESGKDGLWAIQCSNVRPHVYFLDAVRKIWKGEAVTEESQAEAFVSDYFAECEAKEEIEALYLEYPKVMMCLNENESAGELFYTENVRLFCHQLLVDKNKPAKDLCMLEDATTLSKQIQTFGEVCRQQKEELEKLCLACTVTENGLQQKALLSATIGLHIKLHQTCRRAARCFARGYESLAEGDYERAFLRFGDSAVWFDKGDALLRGAEYGVWKNFYANDCITDMKHTSYMVRKVMGCVRELGDNPKHDNWYKKYCLSAEEQEVAGTTVAENHKTDFELYEAMKKQVVR